VRGVEPLVHVDVKLKVHVFKTTIALPMDPSVNASLYDAHAVGLPQLELDSEAVRKIEALERLDRHLVVDDHELTATRKEPADVDLMRTIHKNQCAAA